MPHLFTRPPIAASAISLVVTAWNNAADIEEVIAAWAAHLESLARPFEIILVDDASSDGSGERVLLLTERWPNLRLILHEQHKGIGTALRSGIAAATYPLLITAPADKQFNPPDVQRMLEVIDQTDLVVGYRVSRPPPAWLRAWDGLRLTIARIILGAVPEPRECWLGWAGWRRRCVGRWLFGVRVQDPESPFRLYRRVVFERLPIQSDSAAAHLEILAKANHLECIMGEAPVTWVPPREMPRDPADAGMRGDLRRLFFAPDFGRPLPTRRVALDLERAKAELEAHGLSVSRTSNDSLQIAASWQDEGGIPVSQDASMLTARDGRWCAVFPTGYLVQYEMPGELSELVAIVLAVYDYYRHSGSKFADAFPHVVKEAPRFLIGQGNSRV